MAKFFGNITDQIDLDKLRSSLAVGHQEELYGFNPDGSLPENLDEEDKEYITSIHAAGYKDPICNDMLFYPHYHFDEQYVYTLDRIFGAVCNMCWVNRAVPGRVIIPHRDFDEREELLEQYGTMVRYHIHIGEPQFGHVFVLKDKAFYMQDQGNCYEWDHYSDLHSASNSGLKNKFLFSYRGIRPNDPELFEGYEYIWSDIEESVRIKLKNGTIL